MSGQVEGCGTGCLKRAHFQKSVTKGKVPNEMRAFPKKIIASSGNMALKCGWCPSWICPYLTEYSYNSLPCAIAIGFLLALHIKSSPEIVYICIVSEMTSV